MKYIVILIVAAVVVLLFRSQSKKSLDHYSEAEQPEQTELVKPDGWDVWQDTLEKNTLPSVHISLKNEKPARASQSKFGGQPFWPSDKTYPTDQKGKNLQFIAQINFSELPEGIEGYPPNGLLQFFVGSNDLYGLEFFDNADNLNKHLNSKRDYAVVFHTIEQISDNQENITSRSVPNDEYSPLSGESAIEFTLVNDIASPLDFRFEDIVQSLGDMNDEIEEYAYESLYRPTNHKIGGYAFFTQTDPRSYIGENEEWLLLFQMDTDSNKFVDIMWGDAGVGNFFIRPQDLKASNFDKVWFNWDCH